MPYLDFEGSFGNISILSLDMKYRWIQNTNATLKFDFSLHHTLSTTSDLDLEAGLGNSSIACYQGPLKIHFNLQPMLPTAPDLYFEGGLGNILMSCYQAPLKMHFGLPMAPDLHFEGGLGIISISCY